MNDYLDSQEEVEEDKANRTPTEEDQSKATASIGQLSAAISLKSEFSFKNPVIVRVGKNERELNTVDVPNGDALGGTNNQNKVSEPIPCQESEEDLYPSDDRSISFKEGGDGDAS